MVPEITWGCTAAARVPSWDWAQALCVKVCQLLAIGRRFPPGARVSSTSGHFIISIITLAVAQALNPNKPKQTKARPVQSRYMFELDLYPHPPP